jgi:hypothetical protein
MNHYLIKEADIQYTALMCVYCGNEVRETFTMCCGEVHNEPHHFLENGEALPASECEIIKEVVDVTQT